MPEEFKIVIAGSMGAGKTTAVAALSETAPVRTDAANTDTSVNAKLMTTVAIDYGELTLDGGDRLRIYGTPGQKRFDFMWRIVARGAIGVLILIDNSGPDPLADLAMYTKAYESLVESGAAVVGVTHQDIAAEPALSRHIAALETLGIFGVPVMSVDARDPARMMLMIETLLSAIEFSV